MLAQFAVLGSVYARLLHGKARPRVGLLSNGSEDHKGTPLTRDAHQLLTRADRRRRRPTSSYVGYVEGRDIFRGEVDVVVTDGFTGNVVLKSVEGAAEVILDMVREEVARSGCCRKLGAALMTGALRGCKRRTDYAEHGGAPLLGVDGVALICHGGSNAKAMKNAVLVADRFAQIGLAQGADRGRRPAHAPLWDGAPPAPPAAGAVIVMRSRIIGTGRAVPPKVLTNDDSAKMVDTSDSWIVERTGIRERHILDPSLAASDLAAEAGREGVPARRASRPSASTASSSARSRRDCPFPATRRPSCSRSWARAPGGCAFDLSAACAGFLYGLSIARQRSSGRAVQAACWSSASRCSRASSTGRTATPACCSATARARWCWCPPTTSGRAASSRRTSTPTAR